MVKKNEYDAWVLEESWRTEKRAGESARAKGEGGKKTERLRQVKNGQPEK